MKYPLVVLALLTAVPAMALAQASGPPHVEHEADYIQAIVKYVRNSRGWPDSSYVVTFYGKDGDNLIFSVDYGRGDNATNFVGNEGDSFKVLFNPKTGKVEHEMYFG
jgi:hypothetical protein